MTVVALNEDQIRVYLDQWDATASPTLYPDLAQMARELLWRRVAERNGLSGQVVVIDENASLSAVVHARTHPRRVQPGCEHRLGCRCDPPNHLRCDFVGIDGRRCALGSEHMATQHFFRG